jgi:hypothetical protein
MDFDVNTKQTLRDEFPRPGDFFLVVNIVPLMAALVTGVGRLNGKCLLVSSTVEPGIVAVSSEVPFAVATE